MDEKGIIVTSNNPRCTNPTNYAVHFAPRCSIRSRARAAEGGMVDPTLLPITDDNSSNVDLNSEEVRMGKV
jgi:hypothetical protein